MKNSVNNLKLGFTLVEVSVTMAILSLVLGSVYGAYHLSQKAYTTEESMIEITQNGRVILERLSREIRQATEIVTELPAQEASATSTIIFEDGHITDPFYYIRYLKNGSLVEREIIGFYFSGDSGETLVPWDAIPPQGQTLMLKTIQEAQTIGECVSSIKFWSSKPEVVDISLDLSENENNFRLETSVFGRNF